MGDPGADGVRKDSIVCITHNWRKICTVLLFLMIHFVTRATGEGKVRSKSVKWTR
jgi:hypothetical protein